MAPCGVVEGTQGPLAQLGLNPTIWEWLMYRLWVSLSGVTVHMGDQDGKGLGTVSPYVLRRQRERITHL